MAVLDDHGLGVEVDVARLGNFDGTLFTEGSITSAMLNVIAMREHQTLRPFIVIGAGVIHVSGTLLEGPQSVGRTEVGWNAGGGLLFLIQRGVRHSRGRPLLQEFLPNIATCRWPGTACSISGGLLSA